MDNAFLRIHRLQTKPQCQLWDVFHWSVGKTCHRDLLSSTGVLCFPIVLVSKIYLQKTANTLVIAYGKNKVAIHLSYLAFIVPKCAVQTAGEKLHHHKFYSAMSPENNNNDQHGKIYTLGAMCVCVYIYILQKIMDHGRNTIKARSWRRLVWNIIF